MILVVEDNVGNQYAAKAVLSCMGFEAKVVANGEEAIQAFEAQPYDLILMDCRMPILDGYEATAIIRRSEEELSRHRVPIVGITSYAHDGDRQKCLEAGMDDYLTKPLTLESLRDMLGRWLPRP